MKTFIFLFFTILACSQAMSLRTTVLEGKTETPALPPLEGRDIPLDRIPAELLPFANDTATLEWIFGLAHKNSLQELRKEKKLPEEDLTVIKRTLTEVKGNDRYLWWTFQIRYSTVNKVEYAVIVYPWGTLIRSENNVTISPQMQPRVLAVIKYDLFPAYSTPVAVHFRNWSSFSYENAIFNNVSFVEDMFNQRIEDRPIPSFYYKMISHRLTKLEVEDNKLTMNFTVTVLDKVGRTVEAYFVLYTDKPFEVYDHSEATTFINYEPPVIQRYQVSLENKTELTYNYGIALMNNTLTNEFVSLTTKAVQQQDRYAHFYKDHYLYGVNLTDTEILYFFQVRYGSRGTQDKRPYNATWAWHPSNQTVSLKLLNYTGERRW